MANVLDQPGHLFQRAARIALQAETQGQEEHHLGVGRPLDPAEQVRRHGQHQVTPQQRVFADQAVVDEQPAAEAERMAVGLLRRGAGGCAHVGNEKWRSHRPRGLAQVGVAPGRVQAAVAERHLRVTSVPADAKAVAIGGGMTQPRIQALVDQRVFRLEQHRFQRNGFARVSQPAAHDAPPRQVRPGAFRPTLQL
ncbi:hypothetical protein D3C72_1617970 [compost metagenome]